MGFRVITVDVHEDDRGELYEPVLSGDLQSCAVRNVHAITVLPGKVRGNHYHLEQTESICMGPNIAIYTIEDGELKCYRFADKKRVIVRVPPKIPHAIVNKGEDVEFVVCSSDVLHDPTRPDWVKKVVISK